MREIKFRAWVKNDEHYFYQTGIEWSMNTSKTMEDTVKYLEWFDSDKDEVILMQYTGLKDKNGTEIYEGDIVKYYQAEYNCTTELYEDRLMVCEWYEDQFAGIERDRDGTLISPHSFLRTKVIEVIGNIYENKDLLE